MESKHFNLLKICFIFGLIISTFFALNKLFAAEQVKKEADEIVFGQTLNLDGSFKLYGNIIERGILACFNQVNEEGGINGKKLKLVSMDDRGIPEKSENNINTMMNKYNIDMFLGNMGTRSIQKVLPLSEQGKIAMLFPWGGDKQLRSPELSYIVNGPGLIEPQIDALIQYIVKNLRLIKIALFHSDGEFDLANKQTAKNILSNYNIKPTANIPYNRLTLRIMKIDTYKESPADKIFDTDPKVIICLATSTPTAKLISRFFEEGYYGALFFGIDSTLFVGDILKTKGAKFYYASAVPDPKNTTLPIVKEYQEALNKFFPQESFNILSLTYYISAKIVTEALKKIPGQITKEKLLAEIEKMKDFDLKGFTVKFNPQNRHAFGENISIIKG